MADREAYLIIRSKAPHACFRRFLGSAGKVIERAGGVIECAAEVHEVAAVEPGSVPQHTVVARMPSMDSAKDAWSQIDTSEITEPEPPLVLACFAVPSEGYEDPSIPTHLTVACPEVASPAFLLIEGSASDQAAMDSYRDILLPLMFDNRGYYTVFELGGDVEVLSGSWDEAIFAISRWPDRAAARKTWFADIYQEQAIPLRLDIGRFEVVLIGGGGDA